MKNNYELKQTMLLSIENETLRERVKELKLEIKKLQDEKREREMVQIKGENAIIQE